MKNLSKKEIIISVSIALFFIVFTIILILLNIMNGNVSPSKTSLSSPITSEPPSGSVLKANTNQKIVVTLPQALSTENISINVRETSITNNTVKNISLYPTLNANILSYNLSTAPDTDYQLDFLNTKTNAVFYQAHYISSNPEPTAIPSNNNSLKNFLPYNATNFILEYNSALNLYVFHFIYNPSSADSIDVQLNNAKQDAINFIKSKGIDPNSIVIQYKSS